MCGISGLITHSARSSNREIIESILESQVPRGPDYQAIVELDEMPYTVILGHNRLSIIDLSPGGRQPMWDRDNRLCVVFNGEIYNYIELREELKALGHEFRTSSDTEVILEAFKAWGPRCVERFNGMFAFALNDPSARKFYLFRDRFGVKPLYYLADGEALYFASTGRALAKRFGLKPNLAYVMRGLRYFLYEDDDEISMYEGLRSLRPSHFLEVDAAEPKLRMTLRPYYVLADAAAAKAETIARMGERELLEMTESLLNDAIQLRLRADVPVGVSLSGGLDSSTIAALLAERHADITGFSFAHPDAAQSEGPLVAELVRRTGIKVEYIWPSAGDIVDAFWETLDAQDAPFPAGNVVGQYLMFKRVREHGVKVLLGGQGGDEVFLGYRKFQLFQLRRLLHEGQTVPALAHLFGLMQVALAELPQADMYWANRHRYTRSAGLATRLRLPDTPSQVLGYEPTEPLAARQIGDIRRYSLPTLLRYEDRNSMGNSVESRLPFLDYRLVELGVALPAALKLRNGYGKWILREIMRDKLPASISHARFKRGFDVGQASWFGGGLGTSIRHGLRDRMEKIAPYLPPMVVVDQDFSDANLAQTSVMAEAVSLLWLGDRM